MMRSTGIAACLGRIVALPGAVPAAEPVTVQSLLRQDFAVVGAFTNQAGGGLVLQKKDQLFFCNVTETPQSPAVTTRYCKPVE
jgi:hypothetical protein